MPIIKHTRKMADGTTVDYLYGVPVDVRPKTGTPAPDTNKPSAPAGFVHGYQARPQKVARQITSAGWYPDDGTGTTAASASSGQANVKLAANVLQTQAAGLTPVGMWLAVQYNAGSNLWEVGYVQSWNSGTQTVTLAENLDNTWGSGTKYHLLYDCGFAEELHVLGEANASLQTAVVSPFLFGWIASGEILTRDPAEQLNIEGTSIQGAASEVRETSYYYARVRSITARGFMGAKLRVESLTGTWSWWLARS